MTYVARKTDTKDTAKLCHYYYNPKTRERIEQAKGEDPPTVVGPEGHEIEAPHIKVWVRKFRGRDNRYMNDLQQRSDRKGAMQFRTGTVIREKVVRGVVAIEGMEKEDGTPITAVTKTVYDDYLEQPFIDFCIDEINKHNNLVGDDDEDDGADKDLAADLEG